MHLIFSSLYSHPNILLIFLLNALCLNIMSIKIDTTGLESTPLAMESKYESEWKNESNTSEMTPFLFAVRIYNYLSSHINFHS